MTSRKTTTTLRDKNQSKKSRSRQRGRKLFFEPLEQRTLLTAFSLTNGGTTVQGGTTSSFFLDTFSEGGTDHLWQNNIYYRVGNVGGETSVHTSLPVTSETITASVVDVTYTLAGTFDLRVVTTLSDPQRLDQTVTVTNLTGATLDFHLFDYYDWDMSLSFSNDVANVLAPNIYQQLDPVTSDFALIGASPLPQHYEFRTYDNLQGGLNSLGDSSPTTLNDLPGRPVSLDPGTGRLDICLPVGPDDSCRSFVRRGCGNDHQPDDRHDRHYQGRQ